MSIHEVILGSHVFAGILALLSGLIPMFTKKGGNVHRKSGILFFWSMFWVFFTTITLYLFYNAIFFLLVIGIFSFHMCFTGYRILYRKKAGEHNWLDLAGAYITLVAGIGVEIYAVNLILSNGFNPLSILSLIFGLFTINNAIADLKMFRMKHQDEKLWWFYHHMSAMCGAYIATVTAFLVNVAGPYVYQYPFGWLIWILPAALGVPGVSFWVKYYKQKHGRTRDTT
ncbi:MAG: hypothetical protein AB8F74_14455 [Saprospiraceae bacterium]